MIDICDCRCYEPYDIIELNGFDWNYDYEEDEYEHIEFEEITLENYPTPDEHEHQSYIYISNQLAFIVRMR